MIPIDARLPAAANLEPNPVPELIRLHRLLPGWLLVVLLGWVVNAIWGQSSLLAVARAGPPLTEQIGWGVASGLAMSVPVILLFLVLPKDMPFRRQIDALLIRVDLSGLNPLWISLFAGVCEELAFRGSLQPLIGIGWTSLVFMLAHTQTGRFASMNWNKAAYALIVFAAALALGALSFKLGLVAAMCAHTVVDFIALTAAHRSLWPVRPSL